MTAPASTAGTFEVLDDPCAYLPSYGRFVPLRKLRRLADRERAPRTRLNDRPLRFAVARVA